MRQIEKEKSCQDCGFFVQHYSRQGARFDKVYCGHCKNQNSRKWRMQADKVCMYFADKGGEDEEIKRTAEEVLVFIAKRLDDLATLLENL